MSDDESGNDIETKVVIVGKSTVGKSSIIHHIVTGSAAREGTPTIGGSFTTKLHQYQSKNVLIQIWDTAGHERFRAITPLYYRGAKIAIIVFSVDDIESFADVENWQRNIADTLSTPIPLILVGNKVDLDRRVLAVDGEEKAKRMNARYIETSAWTGQGLIDILDHVAEIMVSSFPSETIDDLLIKRPVPRDTHCC
jgi:small GTP-binding protein